jgi:hypothetical protein
MRWVRFGEHSFQLCINGCEATIVSDLKHAARFTRFLEDSFRVGDGGGKWLLAKDVFAWLDRGDC